MRGTVRTTFVYGPYHRLYVRTRWAVGLLCMICGAFRQTTGVYLLMAQWKLELVAPHAAALTLLVAGLAQWVHFVCDRWHRTLPVWYKAGHVNLNVAQHRFSMSINLWDRRSRDWEVVVVGVQRCVVRVGCPIQLSVDGFDMLLSNTVGICGEYSWVGAENYWQVCVLVISRPGADYLLLNLKMAQCLVFIKQIVFWDMTPSALAYRKKSCGRTCCIQLWHERHCSVSEVGRTSLFPKRQFASTELHGVTS
jgi:hypothetical protein